MRLPFQGHDPAQLERRLRAGASAFAPSPSPALRGRILAALRAAPPRALEGPAARRPGAQARGNWIAAAAALLVLASAWWLTHPSVVRPARERTLVSLSREILGAGARVLTLPARAEDNLRLEAVHLLSDTARVAEGLVRGLPAPLRSKLERM